MATSKLVNALWADDPPATARKILQNAVAGLRGVLGASGKGGAGMPALLTRSPGYLLAVDSKKVDLTQFRELAEQGRDHLTDGRWTEAARDLRAALALWRGPVLADLQEHGVAWPELSVVRKSRLAVLEDLAEAQLATGLHHEVVNQFESLTEAEPLRERLCGQVMLALYRCGRQADALSVYRRTRQVLVETLGLDPSRELQKLERAILDQDPALDLRERGWPWHFGPHSRTSADQMGAAGRDNGAQITVDVPVATAAIIDEPDPPAAGWRPANQPATGDGIHVERKWATILQVQPSWNTAVATDPEDFDQTVEELATIVREEVEQWGGQVAKHFGSVWLALFGVPDTLERDGERAIRAALAICGRFAALAEGSSDRARVAGTTVGASVAVATGEVLVSRPSMDDGHPYRVIGAVIDDCLRLLSASAPGKPRVCDKTRNANKSAFEFTKCDDAIGGWELSTVGGMNRADNDDTTTLLGRHQELSELWLRFDEVRRLGSSALVSIVGEAGTGKSRLVSEFSRAVRERHPDARILVSRFSPFGRDPVRAAAAGLLRSVAGISDSDPTAVVDRKLTAAVHELVGHEPTAATLRGELRDLLIPRREVTGPVDELAALRVCARLISAIAARTPTVAIFEDTHHGGDAAVAVLGELVRSPAITALVLATMRPASSGGLEDVDLELEIGPLSGESILGIIEELSYKYGLCEPGEPSLTEGRLATFQRALLNRIGGNPLFAVEYVRMLRDKAEGFPSPPTGGAGQIEAFEQDLSDLFLEPPPSVQSVIAARLDAMSLTEKSVLQDAAVLGESICPAGVAAVSGRDLHEVMRYLELFEEREFLRREVHDSRAGEPVFAFHSVVVRDLAFSQLSRAARAERQRQAQKWLRDQAGRMVAGSRASERS
ncbi:BTAD domain-containing putative transcriptional regulator [Herbihabitans rhizosphaerae]|uniref:BTAD domain-containing putative transcriptional regulator n=1 Tax=Herbihabitans rhizosphaerae TaxID=1872711 RepID=UPI001F5EB331|nr:BTAD domain-containing putative transcriptional regulator [Herbihabitans rhizosphaerae]